LSYRKELREGIQKNYRKFHNWMKPNPDEPWWISIPKFILKLPVVLLVIAFSPVLFVLIFILFLIAI